MSTNYFTRNRLAPAFIAAGMWVVITACRSSPTAQPVMNNKAIILEAFDQWTKGQGNFFDLLADNATWTITGNSPVSKKYENKKQFIDEVIDPLNRKLSKKLVPRVTALYAEDDMVIALWEGSAIATDGKPYFNTYSWYLKMKNGKIIDVVAFFDTIAFTELWKRI